MRNLQFIEDEIYHIYNRGVEKRTIFGDKKDYVRFIHDLFEFNDENPVLNTEYRLERSPAQPIADRKPRKLLVEILVFTLMSNHFHMLIRPKNETGVSRFMHKLGVGYTLYFNQKYKRVGPLFQGKFKAVHVQRETHLMHIPHYIHANPLNLKKNYGNSVTIDENSAINVLKKYRWSSFSDYVGIKNFPSVTSREFLLDYFEGEKGVLQETKNWIRDWKEEAGSAELINDVTLDLDLDGN